MKRRRPLSLSMIGGLLIGIASTIKMNPPNAEMWMLIDRRHQKESIISHKLGALLYSIPLGCYAVLLLLVMILWVITWIRPISARPKLFNCALETVMGCIAGYICIAGLGPIYITAIPYTSHYQLVGVAGLGVLLSTFDLFVDRRPVAASNSHLLQSDT